MFPPVDAETVRFGEHRTPHWSWDVRPGQRGNFCFWSVWGGSGNLTVLGDRRRLRPGDCFLIDLDGTICGRQSPDDPLHVRFVNFAPSVPPEHVPSYVHFEDGWFLKGILARLRDASYARDGKTRRVWFEAFVGEYLRCGAGRATCDSGDRAAMVRTVCRRFQDEPRDPSQVGEIAEEFGLSADHFIRIFRSHTGMTPHAFRLLSRMESAIALLRGSDASVGRIAESVGYSDACVFSRQFKRYAGVSPSAYRKERLLDRDLSETCARRGRVGNCAEDADRTGPG